MQCDWRKLFWGQDVPEGCSEEVKKLLGVDEKVPEKIKSILSEASRKACSAMQCMDQVGGAFGEGVNLVFRRRCRERCLQHRMPMEMIQSNTL